MDLGRIHVGSKFFFYVSRCEEPRLIEIFVDFEDLMLFVLGFIGIRICCCNFFEIKNLFVEIDDGFVLRRLILTNVGNWNRFLLIESKVGLFE